MINMLTRAKAAKLAVAALSTDAKNAALEAMAAALIGHKDEILAANKLDLDNAPASVSKVMLDRLMLNSDRIDGMAKGILDVVKLPDPVGLTLDEYTRYDGLVIRKTSVPMGVIAIIYESRPNVTSDAAALALKSGGESRAGHLPDLRHRPDDRQRLCGSADPQRRRGPHQRLSEECHRALHRHRHRHLPCVCGKVRRHLHGPEHHRKRQVQPPQCLQRR